MIRLLMQNGENIEIPPSRFGRYYLGQNQEEVKDPKTGERSFVGGNYVNFIFDVLLFTDGSFNQSLFEQLDGSRYRQCNLEVKGEVINFNSNPYIFYIFSVKPFSLDGFLKYEALSIGLGVNTWTPEAAQFLINELDQFILTEDGQKIIIDI